MKKETLSQIDATAMLDQVQQWCAVNSETGNLEGLSKQAVLRAEAFGELPGSVELLDPAALPDGTLTHVRRRTGNYSVKIKGRSDHAGRDPYEGRIALVAATDLILRLKEQRRDDITVNPAKLEGGAPMVDTVGVRGGSIHFSDEFLITAILAERAALSASVIQRLAAGALEGEA